MIKRADVDYFTKSPSLPLTGNDRIAFFSQVPGYGASSLSPISLVAYRINSKNRLERMGKALAWNGDTTTVLPLVFLADHNFLELARSNRFDGRYGLRSYRAKHLPVRILLCSAERLADNDSVGHECGAYIHQWHARCRGNILRLWLQLTRKARFFFRYSTIDAGRQTTRLHRKLPTGRHAISMAKPF